MSIERTRAALVDAMVEEANRLLVRAGEPVSEAGEARDRLLVRAAHLIELADRLREVR